MLRSSIKTTETNRGWTVGGLNELEMSFESLHGVSRWCWISPVQSPLCFGAFWAGPGQAVPCRARPVEGNGASSGEFRLAESDGQLQVFLLLLGEPGESLLFLSLALALCPLYHVFLGWILLHENRGNKETYAHNGCSFETLKTHQQQTFFLQSGHFDWFVITIYVPETKDSESGRTIVGC